MRFHILLSLLTLIIVGCSDGSNDHDSLQMWIGHTSQPYTGEWPDEVNSLVHRGPLDIWVSMELNGAEKIDVIKIAVANGEYTTFTLTNDDAEVSTEEVGCCVKTNAKFASGSHIVVHRKDSKLVYAFRIDEDGTVTFDAEKTKKARASDRVADIIDENKRI